jgi:hypothetical protein
MVFILLGVAAVVLLACIIPMIYLLVTLLDVPDRAGGSTRPQATYTKGGPSGTLTAREVIEAFLLELKDEQIEDAYTERTSVSFQGQMSLGDFRQLIEKNRGFIRHTNYRLSGGGQSEGGQQWKGRVSGGPFGPAEFTIITRREPEGFRIVQFTIP